MKGKLVIITLYLAFIVVTVYAANTQRMFLPILTWIHQAPGSDKVCHFLLAGGLAVAVNWLLNCRSLGIIQLGTVICLVLATLEECSQIWIPNRNFDLWDLTMNTLGILLFGPFAKKLPIAKD